MGQTRSFRVKHFIFWGLRTKFFPAEFRLEIFWGATRLSFNRRIDRQVFEASVLSLWNTTQNGPICPIRSHSSRQGDRNFSIYAPKPLEHFNSPETIYKKAFKVCFSPEFPLWRHQRMSVAEFRNYIKAYSPRWMIKIPGSLASDRSAALRLFHEEKCF